MQSFKLNVVERDRAIAQRLKKLLFTWVRKLPWVRMKIENELSRTKQIIDDTVHKADTRKEFYKFLPERGLKKEELLEEIDHYNSMGSYEWRKGFASGAVYYNNEDLVPLMTDVFQKFLYSNPLHPDLFPGVRKMEAEIVRMCCNMFNGSSNSCGTVTSGGTESILLACLAYRNRAYSIGIMEPEMLIAATAHAAFDKAGELFRIQVIHIPVDSNTCELNVSKMKRAITSNTCMLVGSSPTFPHGAMDPISEVSRLGLQYGIPVHVDACLGGFLIAFMEQAGYSMPLFDFRLPGVTSISCDTHKYGFATKGSSVVLYRNEALRRYQYFSQPDWPGGIYASPTLAGSRSGANIATCWTAMLFYGRRGYVESTRSIVETTRWIARKLKEIEGLQVLGNPQVCVVSFTAKDFNIYTFNDRMNERGWNLNALQFPSAIHIAVTGRHTRPGVKELFINDCSEVAHAMRLDPGNPNEGGAALYGMSQSIPDRSLVTEITGMYLDACYATDPPMHQDENDYED